MRDLFEHLLKNQTITRKVNKKEVTLTTDQHDSGVALSQILNFIQGLQYIEIYFHRTSSKTHSAIFTNTSGSSSTSTNRPFTVNQTIDIKTFDVSALYYFLTCLDLEFLFTRKAVFRKKDGRLSCNGPSHRKKCCGDCVTAGGKLHGEDSSSPCSRCFTSLYACYNDPTPCCTRCNTCDACAVSIPGKCGQRQVRHAINFLHKVWNLNDTNHRNFKNLLTFYHLPADTFKDKDFPGCSTWSTLWDRSSDHLVNIFQFLWTNGIIDQRKYDTRVDEVRNRLPNRTKAELSQMYSEVVVALCDELRGMVIYSEHNTRTSELEATSKAEYAEEEALRKAEGNEISEDVKMEAINDRAIWDRIMKRYVDELPVFDMKQEFDAPHQKDHLVDLAMHCGLSMVDIACIINCNSRTGGLLMILQRQFTTIRQLYEAIMNSGNKASIQFFAKTLDRLVEKEKNRVKTLKPSLGL